MADKITFSCNSLGLYFRKSRLALGYSLRELESLCGVSDSQIYRIEAGDFSCTIDSFIRISHALGLPFGIVLEAVIVPQPQKYQESILNSRELQNFIAAAKIIHPWQRQIAIDFFAQLCVLTEFLTVNSSPKKTVKAILFPSDSLKDRFNDFANRLDDDISVVERASILRSLEKSGYQEIENQCLCDEKIALEHLDKIKKFKRIKSVAGKLSVLNPKESIIFDPLAHLDILRIRPK